MVVKIKNSDTVIFAQSLSPRRAGMVIDCEKWTPASAGDSLSKRKPGNGKSFHELKALLELKAFFELKALLELMALKHCEQFSTFALNSKKYYLLKLLKIL